MGRLVLAGEIINQGLGVFRLEGDDAGELALVVRIAGIEALGDELGMRLILGENDGLAQTVATGNGQATGHQVRQHLVHGVLVEQPLVDGFGRHLFWNIAFLVPFQRIPLIFLLFRQLIVLDPFALEGKRHRDRLGRNKKAIMHGVFQRIGIGRYAVFKIEQAVGVAVHLVLGRGGQPHQQRIEVVEDGPVFLEDRAMRLVDDDQIEMADPEPALAIPRLVDQPHHCRIGRDKDPALGILLGHQVHRGRIGQMPLEGIDRLVHQRHPVRQEEDALGPVAAHQQVAQRDHRAGLARTRRHHQQRLAVMVVFKGLGNPADAACLVEPANDGRIDLGLSQRFPAVAAMDEQFEFRLLVESLYLAWRVVHIIPQPVLIAVRVEDHRPLAELPFQAIGIELRLLLANARTHPGTLGLDQSQWLAVVPPQHIVDKTPVLLIGHAGDLEFPVAGLIQRPTGLLEQQVDEIIAGLCFRVIMGIRLRGGRLLGGADLGAQALQFRIQRIPVGQNLRQLLIAFAQALFKLQQLIDRLLGQWRGLGQQVGIEEQSRSRTPRAAISPGQPVGDMEQFAQGNQRVGRKDGPMAVDRLVAQRGDHLGLVEDRLANRLLETRFVDQRRKIVLVRQSQHGIMLVEPSHRQLQRPPGIETGRARIGMDRSLGLAGGLSDSQPFGVEKRE